MTISATSAQQLIAQALQSGDNQSIAQWFTNSATGQQVQAALAQALPMLKPRQLLGVLTCHANGSATPVSPSGTNVAALLAFAATLAGAIANKQLGANNSQSIDLVNLISTNLT
jgi:hypothetical protein